METSALLMMLGSFSIISAFTFYFFYKVLVTPPKDEKTHDDFFYGP